MNGDPSETSILDEEDILESLDCEEISEIEGVLVEDVDVELLHAGKFPRRVAASAMEEKIRACEEVLGYTFFDKTLIKNALTHSSSTADKRLDNERLEFFGDAVLDLVVREYLYHNYPNHQEGDLTEAKSSVVCRASLARAGKRMDLKSFLFLGRGIGKKRAVPDSLLADAYEAIVAAVYLDGGYQPVKNFILMTLREEIPHAIEQANAANYKSNLQKILQQRRRPLPVYKIMGSSGPEHSRVLEVGVYVDGAELGRGRGSSRKSAEQEAARAALAALEQSRESRESGSRS